MVNEHALELNPDTRGTGRYAFAPLVPRDYADARGRTSPAPINLIHPDRVESPRPCVTAS